MLDFNSHFIPLIQSLEVFGIKFSIKPSNDGLKIIFKDGSDVALNSYTYGCNSGLLEGYKGVFATAHDEVTGWLTAKNVMMKLTER